MEFLLRTMIGAIIIGFVSEISNRWPQMGALPRLNPWTETKRPT